MSDIMEGDVLPKENDNTSAEPTDAELDNEALLRFTQKTRKQLIEAITTGGMPEDKDERVILLRALSDMDTTTINRLRHDVDKASVENDRQVQDIISRLQAVNPRGLRTKEPMDVPEPQVSISDLPEKSFTEEEKRIGVSKETSKDFLERMDHETGRDQE